MNEYRIYGGVLFRESPGGRIEAWVRGSWIVPKGAAAFWQRGEEAAVSEIVDLCDDPDVWAEFGVVDVT